MFLQRDVFILPSPTRSGRRQGEGCFIIKSVMCRDVWHTPSFRHPHLSLPPSKGEEVIAEAGKWNAKRLVTAS
jgi:hypothetical protein